MRWWREIVRSFTAFPVRDQRAAVRDHGVRRLDVPLDHAVAMCVIQRLGDVGRDADRIGHRELTLEPKLHGSFSVLARP